MTDSASTTSSSALEEAIGLLRSRFGEPSSDIPDGYLDLLGEVDALGPHKGQKVFGGRVLPRIYERLWRPMGSRFLFFGKGMDERKERQITLEMLGVSSGDRVIDVGCGTGNYTEDLARAAGDGLVVGIDASATMLAAAARRRGGRNVVYVRGDACALPFEDGSFDAACSVGVIHMVEEPMASLDEMVRVLAPGGRLTVVASFIEKDEKAGRGVPKGLKLFEPDELTGALEAHGLDEIKQQVFGHGQFVSARKPGD